MAESWFGKIKGHVGEARGLAEKDAAQRRAAEQRPQSVILGKNDVQGEYDASRVLKTTLGGVERAMTADDMAAFRRNMATAKANFKGDGITARQVIDLASARPLGYRNPANGSDIKRAREEIKTGIAVSARNAEVRFITNAGPDSKFSRHHVLVKFNAFAEASSRLMQAPANDAKACKTVARWLLKQKLAFDCDCGRHRFFFRYVSTIGNFNAGRDELGYPKIRNPGLLGVACKHVLRVMSEIDGSVAVQNFLTRHLEKLAKSANNRAQHQQTQRDADASVQWKARTGEIKTSEDRAAERRQAKDKAALNKAATGAPRAAKKPASTRKIEAAIAAGKASAAEVAVMRKFNFTDAQIAAKLGKQD